MSNWLAGHGRRAVPALILYAVACGGNGAPRSADVRARWDHAIPVCTDSSIVVLDTVAVGLEVPWDIAFRHDGSALVTERPGRVRQIGPDGVLHATPWLSLEPAGTPGFEVGVMGIAIPAPDTVLLVATFARGRGVPARAWRRIAGLAGARYGLSMENRILRVSDIGGVAGEPVRIARGLGAGGLHAGGAMRLGPDGMAYTTLGDAGVPALAGTAEAPQGSVLRLKPTGGAPDDNPWPGSMVFATGLRNPQGLAWLRDGTLLAVEHGPTGMSPEAGRVGHDELNLITPGGDYGWPWQIGFEPGPGSAPLAVWTPAIAPGGITVPRMGPWTDNVFVTGLAGGVLIRLELVQADEGWQVRCGERLLERTHGRLRAVQAAADGSVWVTTSNRDGRGRPGPSDDLILRLRPRP